MDISAKIYRIIRTRIVEIYNEIILTFLGKKWKVIFINEFPKCGGSWLKRMIGELLSGENYFYNKNRFKLPHIRPRCIIQRHWLKHTKHAYKTIIIIRDPRDAYNSFYFHENYFAPHSNKEELFGYNSNLSDKDNMYAYLQSKINNPSYSTPGFTYKKFWDSLKGQKDTYIVKYEDLRKDTFKKLKSIMQYLEYNEIPDKQLLETIDKCSFSKIQRQQVYSDDRKNFARKGIVGDWKNNFNERSIQLFKENFSDMLIEMGYESDENWK